MPAASSPTASEQELRDAYRLLGVDTRASALAIKLRYRELVQIHHPDKWPQGSADQEAATSSMRDINVAYDLISDAPLQQVPVWTEPEERTSEEYEAAYRANQQIDRLLNVDVVRVLRFLCGAVVGSSLVIDLHHRGVVDGNLYVWMVGGTLLTGFVFVRMSWFSGAP